MFKLGFFPHGGGTPATYVQIGTQKWNLKNLDVITYRNNDPIPYASNTTAWNNYAASQTGCYASVNFNPANDAEYGFLYNGYAIKDSRQLAPEGWHIPTYEEVNTLINYLGGWPFSGGPLKETGTTHWNSPNTGATNSSGFTNVGAGYITNLGVYTLFKQQSVLSIYDIGVNQETFVNSNIDTNTLTSLIVSVPTDIKGGYSVRTIRNDSLALGDLYGGGVIYGLEGDPFATNFKVSIVLDDVSYVDSYGCLGSTVGAGSDTDYIGNTMAMDLYSCNIAAPFFATNPNVYNFNNWFLAAKNQAQIILDDNRVSGVLNTNTYWTSTEVDSTNAKAFSYSSGWNPVNLNKLGNFTFFVVRDQYI